MTESGSVSPSRAGIYAYRIPLLAPLELPGTRVKERWGLVLKLTDSRGVVGWGEAAPLPGFSRESLAQCREALVGLAQQWLGGSKGQNSAGKVADSPSARFAFDCACQELDRGPLSATVPLDPYPLLSGDPDALLSRWQHWASPRPATIKLKLGRHSANEEARLIGALLRISPELRLRLDANRAWSRSQAEAFFGALPGTAIQAIEYLEEPCRLLEESLEVAAQHRLPLALDESLREPGFQLPSSPFLCALILKPGLTGSLTALKTLLGQARQRGLRTVLSSGYESSLGTGQIAALAQQLTPGEPPGLDTQQLFSAHLLRCGADTDTHTTKPTLTLSDLECLWQA